MPSVLFNEVVSELKISLLHSHLRTEVKLFGSQELSTLEKAVASIQGLVLILQRGSHQWSPHMELLGLEMRETGDYGESGSGAWRLLPVPTGDVGHGEEGLAAGCTAGAVLVGLHGTGSRGQPQQAGFCRFLPSPGPWRRGSGLRHRECLLSGSLGRTGSRWGRASEKAETSSTCVERGLESLMATLCRLGCPCGGCSTATQRFTPCLPPLRAIGASRAESFLFVWSWSYDFSKLKSSYNLPYVWMRSPARYIVFQLQRP